MALSRGTGRAETVSERRALLIENAARLFARKGFEKTSMREIAASFGVLPGSLYHHFSSKEELFIAAYSGGVDQIIAAVEGAIEDITDPRDRLEEACVAHLQQLLAEENPMVAVLEHWAMNNMEMRPALIRERDRYERLLRGLIDAVTLPPGTDRRSFRLALLGAMNWTLTWYKPGRDPPDVLARRLFAILHPPSAAPSGRRCRSRASRPSR
jgi:AcrR family transcriptional regulator